MEQLEPPKAVAGIPVNGRAPTPEQRLRWRGVAGLIVLIVLALGAAAVAIWGWPELGRTVPYVAYFEGGDVDIPVGTVVYYRREAVGKADTVESGRSYYQAIAYRIERAEHRDVRTLRIGEEVALADGTTITYRENDVAFTDRGYTTHVVPDEASENWYIPFKGAQVGGTLNGVRLDSLARRRADGRIYLFTGDLLRFNEIDIEWNRPALFTRVAGTINESKVAELSNNPAFLRGGSRLTRGSTFDLTAPSLTLTSSSDSTKLFAVDAREFATNAGIDLMAAVNELGRYVFTKRYLDAPPRNRAERLIADANGFLPGVGSGLDTLLVGLGGNVDAISGDVSGQINGIGGRVQNTTLPLVEDELKRLQRRLSEGVTSLEVQIQALRDSLDRPLKSADLLLRDANTTVNGVDLSLAQTMDEIATTLRNINLTVAKLKRTLP
jgi:hypothetical protein